MKLSFYIFLAGYICYQLYSLDLQPMPWFDETFFASIAHNFWLKGTFVPEIAATAMEQKPVLLYGPIYFILTSLSFKLLGFGIWQFRIVQLLFGFIVVFLILKIKNQSLNQKSFVKMDLFWASLLLCDPFFNLILHEGRMEFVALTFILISICLIYKSFLKTNIYYFIFSGISISLALLTSPRVFFILIGLSGLMIFFLYQKRVSLKNCFILLITSVITYSIWIIYVGGFLKFKAIYFGTFDNSGAGDSISNYIFSNFYIPKHEYLLISIVILVLLFTLMIKKELFKNELVLTSLVIIILFYCLIKDWGPYSAYILPLYYLILMILIEQLLCFKHKITVNVVKIFSLILISFNVFIFGLRMYYTLSTINARSQTLALNFVKKHIPKGSKVIGDATYYYAVVQNGSTYEYIDKYGTLENRELVLRTKYHYKYIIVSDIEKDRYLDAFKYFNAKSKLKLLATLDLPQVKNVFLLSGFDSRTYSCKLYKVVD